MQERKRKKRTSIFALVVIASGLTLLSASCKTPPAQSEQVKPAYPDLGFPTFPIPDDGKLLFLPAGTTITFPDGGTKTIDFAGVAMSLDYWLRITDYKIEIDRVKRSYSALSGTSPDDSIN